VVTGVGGISRRGLNRLKASPSARIEVLLSTTGTVTFSPILGDRAPQLLLSLATDTGDAPFGLLDTDTLKIATFPSQRGQALFQSASSDGRWLAFLATVPSSDPSQPVDHQLFVYDWTAGKYATVDSARVGKNIGSYVEWRPAVAELWFSTLPDGFAVWRPAGGVTKFESTLNAYARLPDGKSSVFTRDGRHWFSAGAGDRPTFYVGQADDPTAPLLLLNPLGTVTALHWETDDGRLLVGAWTLDVNRQDIYLIDVDAGTSRAIASAGHVVALGGTRALALLNWEVSRAAGDLTLVVLASGAHTLVAADVYAVAVDRGISATILAGSDALAPGTRVAYLTKNRLASPWDGLWVASLP
jgi:hypothetical protein